MRTPCSEHLLTALADMTAPEPGQVAMMLWDGETNTITGGLYSEESGLFVSIAGRRDGAKVVHHALSPHQHMISDLATILATSAAVLKRMLHKSPELATGFEPNPRIAADAAHGLDLRDMGYHSLLDKRGLD